MLRLVKIIIGGLSALFYNDCKGKSELAMKVNPLSFIRSKKGLAGLACVTLLVTAAFFIQDLSSRIRKITVLGEGVQTCYQRIHQSYTARVLGDTSAPYLEKSFLSSTQDCLADTTAYFEQHLGSFLTGGVTLLNDVNELTHAFHEKLSGLEGNPENVVVSVLGRRFERVETKKDEFLEKLEAVSSKAMASYSSLKWSFFLLIGLVSFFFMGELWNNWSLATSNEELEGEANRLLHDPTADSEKVGTLLTEALENNGLPQCALLVNGTARQAAAAAKSKKTEEVTTEDLIGRPVPVYGKSKEEVEAQIDAIWDESITANPGLPTGAPIPAVPSVSLNESLGNTLELLSSRFVTSAVTLDTNVPNGMRANGTEEEIQQIIYLLLNQSLSSCELGDRESHISINGKSLGSTTFLTIFDSGAGFSKEFMEFNKGLTKDCPNDCKDLLVVKEFAKDLKADLSFENLMGSTGDVVGAKIQIALRSPAKEEGKRLVSLKKGKKKDLEASLS